MSGHGWPLPRQAELLDSDAIRARRVELRMTENQLGRRIGKSGQLVRRIEAGLSHEGLTLRVLARLAGALGLPVGSLLLDHPEDELPERGTGDAGPAILALLVEHGAALNEAAIATVLGMSQSDMQASVVALAKSLRGTGLVLNRTAKGVAVEPDRKAVEERAGDALQVLRRAQPIGLREAGMLLRVLAGEIATATALDRPSGMVLAKLAEAGAVELSGGQWLGANPPRVAGAVAFSLMLR